MGKFSILIKNAFMSNNANTSFANMFNFREVKKQMRDPLYHPIHMFKTFFAQTLCFEIPNTVDGEADFSKKKRIYRPLEGLKHTKVRIPLNESARRST